jgi:Flp pilus assembly protein TadG
MMKKQKKNKRRGQSLIEVAVALPVLILVLSGLFEIGRVLLFLIAIENAAAEGALYGATHFACLANNHIESACEQSVNTRVAEEAQSFVNLSDEMIALAVEQYQGSPSAIVQLAEASCSGGMCEFSEAYVKRGNILRVDVEATFDAIMPYTQLFLKDGKITINASARQEIFSQPPPGTTY